MKLGSLRHGRDGIPVVVSRDNQRYAKIDDLVTNLQSFLDAWDEKFSAVNERFQKLDSGELAGDPVDLAKFAAPLPRAYEWVDGSAYINHIVLVRKARGAEPPETLKTSPLVYQGGSGVFLGPNDDIPFHDDSWGLDFESEVCVILADTPQGTRASEAEKYVRLVAIANDVSLRGLIPEELQKGFGFFNSKPATAFAPFVVTPDELGEAWQQGRLHRPLLTDYRGERFGDPDAGPEMFFSFYDILEHICKTRSFTAGTILGSGTISNEDRSRGSSCLAEKRMIEKIDNGEITTPFMKPGDTVEIKMLDEKGNNIFGTIHQKVVQA